MKTQGLEKENNDQFTKITKEQSQKQKYSKIYCQDDSQQIKQKDQQGPSVNFQKEIKQSNFQKISFSSVIIIGIIAFVVGIVEGVKYQKPNSFCESIFQDSNVEISKINNFRQINDSRFYKRTIFNQYNAQKPFGKDEKLFVNITKLIPNAAKDWKPLNPYDTKGPQDTKYTLIPQDLDRLINAIDFQKVKQNVLNYVSYELLEFEYDKSINMSQPRLNYQYFKNDKQIQDYLQNIKKQAQRKKQQHPNNLKFQLASLLIRNPTKRQVLQAEFYFFNKIYNISSRVVQSPMCIYGGGYNLYKRDQYKQFFQTIQRLNYTNYHIVYVDDNSEDEFSYKIYDYIKTNNFKLKNRIKIIRTLQTIGNLGNLFIFMNKYCNEEDTVVMMDGDDGFVGTQPLQVLNKLYEQKKDCWYIYTRLIKYNPKENKIDPGDTSSFLDFKTSEYRRTGLWKASSLRSFKAKLIKVMPIYQLAEYHFDSTTGLGWPMFPISAADVFLVHALFQLAGNDRIKFIDDYFYNYYPAGASRSCYILHQLFDGSKSVLRTPLQKLGSLEQKPMQVKNYSFPQNKFKEVMQIYRNAFNYKCYTK